MDVDYAYQIFLAITDIIDEHILSSVMICFQSTQILAIL